MSEQVPAGKSKKELKAEIKAIKVRAAEEIQQLKEQATQLKADLENVHETNQQAAVLKAQRLEAKLQKKQYEASLPKRYTIGEEICNSITHGIGAGLAIAALVLLVVKGAIYAPVGEKGFYITSFAIYGASLFILYLMSTLYHALTPYGAKKVFAVFDHSCIYLLIAGTYTPFCLTVLRPTVGWWLFGIIWGLALAGMTFYAIFGKKMRALSVITYILMGWLVIFAIKPMVQIVPPFSLKLLVWGGVAYTVGCVFYAMKKVRWTHSIWHVFVMLGSILHFFSIYYLF